MIGELKSEKLFEVQIDKPASQISVLKLIKEKDFIEGKNKIST